MSTHSITRASTAPELRARKPSRDVGAPITMLTAYDYPMARILDEAGVDSLLVGDSVGTVIYGEPNTLSMTVDKMIPHVQAVARAAKHALVVADLPFMSYQTSVSDAVRSAGRMLQEGRAQAVKLEGGLEWAETIAAIVRAGIPVVGHIGLMPQSVHAIGGYRSFGKTDAERKYLLESARALENAGAFAIVLECVKATLAFELTNAISIPTIGIGAGTGCDGQVLVTHDLVGLTQGHIPSFVHPEADLKVQLAAAVRRFQDRTTYQKPNSEALTPLPAEPIGHV